MRILSEEQTQELGDGTTGIQAGRDVNVYQHGVTYSEAKEVALDVLRTHLTELTGIARDTARERAEEITEEILKNFVERYPRGLQKAIDPDFQYALSTVQRQYARSGDKDLGRLLVDLLVDRSRQDQRNVMQIVLNEALMTAPKLTSAHVDTLAITFLFKQTRTLSVIDSKSFGEYLDKFAHPFISRLTKSRSCYQHLEYASCGTVGISGGKLESVLGITYQGLFLNGFTLGEIEDRRLTSANAKEFFVPCLNDPEKLQVRAVCKEMLEETMTAFNISQEDRPKIIELFDLRKLGDAEIKDKIILLRPYMADVFESWDNSAMQTFTLTSVGIAIAHAQIKSVIGEDFADLNIWIN